MILSVAMIVRDEEQNLARCLDSVRAVADEIVVVDTGSKDATPDIAAAHGAVVVHEPWRDDFSAARNVSLDACHGSWIFVIDADETLEEGAAAIRTAMGSEADALLVQVWSQTGKNEGWGHHESYRLFRADPAIRYRNIVHNELVGFKRPGSLLAVKIRHFGYNLTAAGIMAKVERSLPLLERIVLDEPTEPWHWYNLAQAWVLADRPDKVKECAPTAIKLAEQQHPKHPVAIMAKVQFAWALVKQDYTSQAYSLASQVARACPDYLDATYMMALASLRCGKFQEAMSWARQFEEQRKDWVERPRATTLVQHTMGRGPECALIGGAAAARYEQVRAGYVGIL